MSSDGSEFNLLPSTYFMSSPSIFTFTSQLAASVNNKSITSSSYTSLNIRTQPSGLYIVAPDVEYPSYWLTPKSQFLCTYTGQLLVDPD